MSRLRQRRAVSSEYWQKLKLIPDKEFGKPFITKQNELMVPLRDAILKYDMRQNQWNEYLKYPKSFNRMKTEYDMKKEILYILQPTHLSAFDLNTNTISQLNCRLPYYTNAGHSALLSIDANLYLFGVITKICNSFQNNVLYRNRATVLHIIFNTKINNFTKIDTSIVNINYDPLGAVHLQKSGSILLITTSALYAYDIDRSKWNLQKAIPNKLKLCNDSNFPDFGYVISKNERYVILFSGDVWIIDLFAMKMKKSTVLCPKPEGSYHALIMDQDDEDEILTDGFIRDFWRKYQVKMVRFFPDSLSKLVQCFFCSESIHLFECSGKMGHWKIRLNDILTC